MANLITRDPIELDTTDSAIVTGRTINLFKWVEWVAPAALGAKAILLDADDNTICDFTCTIPDQNLRVDFGDLGAAFRAPLSLETLASGKLLVKRV
jgi:hypothetical protein